MTGLDDINRSVTTIGLSNNSIVSYSTFLGERTFSKLFTDNQVNLANTVGNGLMKGKKKTRARKIISNWLTCSGKRSLDQLGIKDIKPNNHTFVTLTLPSAQMHSDKEIKRQLLTPFVQRMTKADLMSHYYWRAEAQANGNIHFHFILDGFVAWQELRRLWNIQLKKLGYVDVYQLNMKEFHKDGFRVRYDLISSWSLDSQFIAYKDGLKSDFTNPNSVDIHSFKDIDNVSAYVIKYMSKDSTGRLIQGRIHGYSDGLQLLDCYREFEDKNVRELLEVVRKDKSVKEILLDKCVVYYGNIVAIMKKYELKIFDSYKQHIVNNSLRLKGLFVDIVNDVVNKVSMPVPVFKLVRQLDLFQ